MLFRIADPFTESLAKLTGDEQKSVKTTAFDMQLNPANPGIQMHKLTGARDGNFWSARASRDVRLIVHRTKSNFLLCYVDHHDAAYDWAQRRKLERHPKTGAAQLVEIRETVREIEIPKYVDVEQPTPTKPPLLANRSDDELLGYGVPPEWLADVKAANEDSLFEVSSHLPREAAEALLELATGGQPSTSAIADETTDPFAHPDAQRRFRLMSDQEELKQALDYPWEKWVVFLHPAQRAQVEREYNGPARVAGSAGTGKTVVALHRAAYLARRDTNARGLVTTFSDALAGALKAKLRLLAPECIGNSERILVGSILDVATALYADAFGTPAIADASAIREILLHASNLVEKHKFTQAFLNAEWNETIDAWGIDSLAAYQTVPRLGRKTRLGEQQRRVLWSIFEKTRSELTASGLVTESGMFIQLASHSCVILRRDVALLSMDTTTSF